MISLSIPCAVILDTCTGAEKEDRPSLSVKSGYCKKEKSEGVEERKSSYVEEKEYTLHSR
jgi:hypothetical protein